MKVYIVSLEWNEPPSESTGDPGIVGVFFSRVAAEAAATEERRKLVTDEGLHVYGYCLHGDADGELIPTGQCEAEDRECNTDHDEWDIDVHITAHTVQGDPAGDAIGGIRF